MERLQSAIAKARAARQSLSGLTVPPATSGPIPAHAAAPAPSRSEPALEAVDLDAVWTALPPLTIPDERLIEERIVSVGRGSETVEFDKLRTRVLQRMQAKDWSRLAITSPGPSCGKSTISLNLAFGLARQENARVMVIELDMHRPSFRRMLGLGQGRDFSRVLAGRARPEEHLIRVRDNLAIGVTSRVADSAEFLHSQQIAGVLDDLQARYKPSIMIFDLPPYKVSDDTISFVDKTDCVLIIAAAGQTSIEDLDDTEREISAQSQVLGVVLNKCRFTGQDSQYYYYG